MLLLLLRSLKSPIAVVCLNLHELFLSVSGGDRPGRVEVDDVDDNVAYVVNRDSSTVSMINGTDGNYRNVANVSAGDGSVDDGPFNIAVNEVDNIL